MTTELTILTSVGSKVSVSLNGEEINYFVALNENTGIPIERLGKYTVTSTLNGTTRTSIINIDTHKIDYILDLSRGSIAEDEPPLDNEVLEALNKEIANLKNLNNIYKSTAEIAEERANNLEAQVSDLKNAVSSFAYENQKLKEENTKLTERIEKVMSEFDNIINNSDFIEDKVKQCVESMKDMFATVDPEGTVNSTLPSYVDDVLEGYLFDGKFYEDGSHVNLMEGESGKLYIDISTNTSYRFDGTNYISVSYNIEEIPNEELKNMWEKL